MNPSSLDHDGLSPISMRNYQLVMWTLCGLATLFLASRFAVRMWTKGHLIENDYLVAAALPVFCAAVGLLQSVLGTLYVHEAALARADQEPPVEPASAAPRLTSVIELLWITIYCVKFCFLAQFKFHKPPYAYASVHLTRYYFTSIGVCTAALLFTLMQPIILCAHAGTCRYFGLGQSTVPWEMAVTAIDIVTDCLVISTPVLLICMANFNRSRAIINTVFKGLSIFSAAVAAVRLRLQYDAEDHRIHYVSLTFWLVVEAALALIMASISSFRVPVLDKFAEWESKNNDHSCLPEALELFCTARVSSGGNPGQHKKQRSESS